MENLNQLGKEYNLTTRLHTLKFLQVFTRPQRVGLIINALASLTCFILSAWFTQMTIFGAIFLFASLLGWTFFWFRTCRQKLIKLYYLYKESPDVYVWVEKWDLKDKYKYSNPDYYWAENQNLIRVYDNINTYTQEDNPTELPIPFRPFDTELGSVTSIDLARTQEQSAAERLFTSLKKNLHETIKLGFFVLIIGGLIIGTLALLGD